MFIHTIIISLTYDFFFKKTLKTNLNLIRKYLNINILFLFNNTTCLCFNKEN